MRSILKVILMAMLLSLVACSASEPGVDGKPPETPKLLFKASSLQGTFETKKRPTVIMWPTVVDGVELNRDQQIAKRAEIIYQSEVLAAIDLKMSAPVGQRLSLEKAFLAEKCGLYDDFFPDVGSVDVDDWIEPADEVEAKAIAACQENQNAREQLTLKAITPLCEAKGKTSLELLQAVGQENYLASFEKLTVKFENGAQEPLVEIVGFQGRDFSSLGDNEFFKIKKIIFDKKSGLLSFSVPYLQETADGGETIYVGEYLFGLEITQNGSQISMAGEIKRVDQFRGKIDLGRATFSGSLDLKAQVKDPCG